MYIVSFCKGPLGSPISQFGVQVTDSPYAVLNMYGIPHGQEDRLGEKDFLCLACTRLATRFEGVEDVPAMDPRIPI